MLRRSGCLLCLPAEQDGDQRNDGGGHEVAGGSQVVAGLLDEQRGHERRRAAEERVGQIEADREAAVAHPGWEQLGQEAGQGAVIEGKHGAEQDLHQQMIRKLAGIQQHEGRNGQRMKQTEAVISTFLRP